MTVTDSDLWNFGDPISKFSSQTNIDEKFPIIWFLFKKPSLLNHFVQFVHSMQSNSYFRGDLNRRRDGLESSLKQTRFILRLKFEKNSVQKYSETQIKVNGRNSRSMRWMSWQYVSWRVTGQLRVEMIDKKSTIFTKIFWIRPTFYA